MNNSIPALVLLQRAFVAQGMISDMDDPDHLSCRTCNLMSSGIAIEARCFDSGVTMFKHGVSHRLDAPVIMVNVVIDGAAGEPKYVEPTGSARSVALSVLTVIRNEVQARGPGFLALSRLIESSTASISEHTE